MTTKSLGLGSLLGILLVLLTSTTAWAAQRTLTADGNGGYYINMPATGVDTLVIPDEVTTFKVYDDGGPEGGYTPNSDGFLMLTAPEGHLLRLTGSTGAVNSYLEVYDGPDQSNYLFSQTGFRDIGRTLSTGRNLLLEFETYSTVTDGLYLEVTVVDPAAPHAVVITEVNNGGVSAIPTEANSGMTVSLTISPADGYYLERLDVTDEYNNSLAYDHYGNPVNGFTGGKWYSGGVASFTMPGTDVIVRSTFYRIDKYLDLQMPSTGELPVIIPNSVSTFLIRPDYYGTENITIVLTAPEGKILQIMSEDMTNEGDDSLYVYDGIDEGAALLKKGLAREVGRLISTQHVMTLHYKGDGHYRSRDAFRVTVLDPSEYNNITVTNGTGGTVAPSVNSATANTSITLTATSDDGYMLDYVEVYDAEGLKVDVNNATWYESGEMSFKMPGSAVEIKPVFVRIEDGPSINMLKNGTFVLTIPEGIERIHIYDDGGKDGKYSHNCDGYLLLTAPEGKRLRLTGFVRVRQSSSSSYTTGRLRVYNGANNQASELLDEFFYRDIPQKLSLGNQLFFNFISTYSDRFEGVNLTVTVDDPNAPHAINIVSVDDGSFVDPPTEAVPGTVVTLTASPNSGFFFNDVKIQDEYFTDYYESNVDFVGGWYTNNTITFTMPQTEVTVTPSFDYVRYADLVIKKSGTENISIPTDIKSFDLKVGYSDDAIDSYMLLTAPEGKILQIQGEVAPRTGLDSLYVYDGADISATELLKAAARASVNKNSSGRNMLIHYKELGEYCDYGSSLSLRVFVVDPDAEFVVSKDGDIYGGSIEVDKASAKFNTPVTVTATPAGDNLLNKIEVIGKDSDYPVAVTGGTWYSSNKATFAMPAEDVDVSATFVSNLTADGGLSVSTPILEPLRIVVPNRVKSFRVLGRSPSTGMLSQPLILTASEGQMLMLDDNDYPACSESVEDIELPYYNFYICDGDISNPSGETTSGKTISILFGDNGESYMDMTVNVVDPSKDPRSVFVETTGCGQVESELDLETVTAGTLVKLVAIPDEGCFVGGTRAMGSMWDSEFPVSVTGGAWHSNDTIQFTMPYADVSVNVMFGEDPYRFIIVPTVDTVRAEIPEGISQFIVYDDGGPDGPYSNNADGYLVVTVPEDKLLRLDEKYLNLESCCDYLSVYDGDNDITEAFLSDEYMDPIQSLTFHFTSNRGTSYDGFELVMSAVEKEEHQIVLGESEYGLLSVAPVTGMAFSGDTVTINATPNEGYVFNGISVYDDDENWLFDVVDGAWYSNFVKFAMPLKDIYVEPIFVTSDDLDYEINIPKTGNIAINIPVGATRLTVYDDNSGYYGAYSNNSDGSVTLTAPEGYSLYVGGAIQTAEEADSLVIYDGADANAPKLLKKYGEEEFYDIYSSGRSLTFRFKSNAEWNSYGLQLSVFVLEKSGSGAVAIYEADGYKMARIDGAYNGKDTVNIEEDIEVNGVEFNRKFSTAEDGYSTLMLPFDVSTHDAGGIQTVLAFNDVIDSIVDGVKKKFVVMQALWDADTSSQNIVLKANTPYLVKMWNSQLSIDGPVTLRKTENTVLTLGDWQVHGTTAYKKWQTGDPELGSVYGFAANAKDGVEIGQFVKAGTGAYIRPMRAYLLYNPSNPEPKAAPANHVSVWRDNELPEEIDIVVVGGGKRAGIAGGETQPGDGRTVIGTINTRTGEIKFKRTYDLKGRPVSGTPKAKGMYIKGKK